MVGISSARMAGVAKRFIGIVFFTKYSFCGRIPSKSEGDSMRNKGLIVVVVVMSFVILLLSTLCAFLVIKLSATEKMAPIYSEEDSVIEQDIVDMDPWERYEKGYVFFKADNSLYHIIQCANMAKGDWIIVTEEYAVIRGSRPCHVCMPGAK